MGLIILNRCFYNELIYLEEWYNFHISQGVDLIYLYIINKNSNKYDYIINNLNKRNIKLFYYNIELNNKTCKNLKSLYDKSNQNLKLFFNNYYQKHINDWLAIIDIDEFLYSPLKDKKITDIIDIYEKEKKYAIVINWKCFGSNNLEKNSDKKVLHKFTKCAEKYNGINTTIKSLFKISAIDVNKADTTLCCHKYVLKKEFNYYTTTGIEFVKNNKKYFDKLKKVREKYLKLLNLKNNFNINFIYTYPEDKPNLVINHYIVRSKEEYLLKMNNNPIRKDRYNLKNFILYNTFLNEVENRDILDKL